MVNCSFIWSQPWLFNLLLLHRSNLALLFVFFQVATFDSFLPFLGSDDISIEDNSADTQIEEKDYNSIKYYMEIKRCNSSLTKILIVILHLFQVTLAYFLMLIVMNLNYWLCGAVILGSTMGHFVF